MNRNAFSSFPLKYITNKQKTIKISHLLVCGQRGKTIFFFSVEHDEEWRRQGTKKRKKQVQTIIIIIFVAKFFCDSDSPLGKLSKLVNKKHKYERNNYY